MMDRDQRLVIAELAARLDRLEARGTTMSEEPNVGSAATPMPSAPDLSNRVVLLEQRERRFSTLLERVGVLEQQVRELQHRFNLAQGGEPTPMGDFFREPRAE